MLSIKRIRGFTLIEVMLAMAVFAIAGLALLNAASNNAQNMGYLEDKMFANWVASNQLVAANLDKSWPPKNNAKGEEELAGRKWFWRKKVVKTTDKNMRAVTIEVRLNEEEKLPLTSLTTYLAKAED